MKQRRVIIGLGASLSDRMASLRLAVAALAATPGITVLRLSRVYRSAPAGGALQAFLNGAVLVRTALPPRELLKLCKGIEQRLGRRPSRRWADRVIDLDLLLVEGVVLKTRLLSLPHPQLLARDFALWPALEVGAELVLALPACRGVRPSPTVRTGCVAVGVLMPRQAKVTDGEDLLAGLGPLQYTGAPARRQTQGTTHRRRRATGRPPMKIFLDTANIDEIREAHAWGVIDGVTTNPTLVAREGGDLVDRIYQICNIVQGPVSAETVATDWEGMVKEGRLLAQISEHVVVKVPLTVPGLRATRVLADDGIDVNVTLCFQASQALLAAKAGAAYISPFVGRLDDISADGVELIEQIVAIYANYPDLGTEVLAASIRHPMHFAQVALAGSDVVTLPFSTLKKLVKHPLTDSGLERFLADWAEVPDPDIAGQVERWLAARDSK